MKKGNKRFLTALFIIGCFISIAFPCMKVHAAVEAPGTSAMFVGETKKYGYDNFLDGFSITSYNWSLSTDAAYISERTYNSCVVTARTAGTANLYYSVTMQRTYWIYEDVARTKKKYITQTETHSYTWKITIGKQHTVTFDANGGTVSQSGKEVGCGGGYTYGELPVPVKGDYIFDGWFTEDGTLVSKESVVSIDANHTLYAHWVEPHSYTVRFDGNGSTGGKMADMRCEYGKVYALPANAFTKEGNGFVRWCTHQSGTGGISCSNKAYFSNLSKTDDVVTFYAQWSDADIACGTVKEDKYLTTTDLTWVIDAEGTLTVSGSGPIPDVSGISYALRGTKLGWHNYRTKVKNIIIDDGVTGIGGFAFANMTEAETLQIFGNISVIDGWAFNYCSSLQSIQIPGSVTEIGTSAFNSCSSLQSVQIPDGVTKIGALAFDDCSSLKTVIIPNSVNEIGEFAFYGCSGLRELSLGTGVRTIGEEAFVDCGVTQVLIPAQVDSIGSAAFSSKSLKKITVDPGNRTFADVDGILFDYNETEILQFPGGYDSDIYVIPYGVTKLGGGAFYGDNTALRKLIVPATVKNIGRHCFFNNQTIKEIYFRGTPPALDNEEGGCAFTAVTATLYYPESYSGLWNNVKTLYSNAYNASNAYNKINLTWQTFALHSQLEYCTVTVDSSSANEYDGEEKMPKVLVSDSGVVLEEGQDYFVSYSNNINAGTASVCVSGTNGYSGEKSADFTIYRGQQSMQYCLDSEHMEAGESKQIENVSGVGAITYESSNPDVATVSEDGKITGIKVGSVVIKIKAAGDANYENEEVCLDITVEHNPLAALEKLSAEKPVADYCIGQAISLEDLEVCASYRDGYSSNVTDYSTNIDDIDMDTEGEKKLIIHYTENGNTVDAELKLHVAPHIARSAVRENEIAATKDKSGSYDEVIYCTVCEKEMSRSTHTILFSDSSGCVHQWGPWKNISKATVFAPEKQKCICSVCGSSKVREYGKVLKPYITLTANSLKMQVKQATTKFKVTAMADGDSVISVKSSDTKVLKVSGVEKKGTFKLKAQKKTGTAKLTVTLASGLKKTIKISVGKAKVSTKKITLETKKISLRKGKKAVLKPVVSPVTSQQKIAYKSSDKKVADVNQKGTIMAKGTGTAKITVISGKKKAVVTVKVTK